MKPILKLTCVVVIVLCLVPNVKAYDVENEEEMKARCERTIEMCNKAIAKNRKNAEAYAERGEAYSQIRDSNRALADFNKAIRLNPKKALYYYHRAFVFMRTKARQKAIADLSRAIALSPKRFPADAAYYARGREYLSFNNYKAAIRDYRKALMLGYEDFNAGIGMTEGTLAWLLATNPDAKLRNGKEALKWARKYHKTKDPDVRSMPSLEILAAAYAENGQYCKAVHWQKLAVNVSDYNYDKRALLEAKKRLSLYQQGKPYRFKKFKLPGD